jgi:hypothetical protein
VLARIRKRLAESARAFSATAGNPSLRRAQLAFGATWTAEWAFTVALAFVAFRDDGATAPFAPVRLAGVELDPGRWRVAAAALTEAR